ncbi:MAG: hypothetical protein HQ595_01135 [Candidatus Omnitrophica bacterium]|nr:hypothetical protein [Candidatus Omnitrophota bacterium]
MSQRFNFTIASVTFNVSQFAGAKLLGFLFLKCYNAYIMEAKKYKCVLVTGPEGSGSRLVARIISQVLGIQEFELYNGIGASYKGKHRVEHFSLPSGPQAIYPDIKTKIENNKGFELYLVLATRDINISGLSRMNQYGKKKRAVAIECLRAQSIISGMLSEPVKSFIWSYETFMFLKRAYLNLLYEFLGVESDFLPELIDGNKKYLKRPKTYWGRKFTRLLSLLQIRP